MVIRKVVLIHTSPCRVQMFDLNSWGMRCIILGYDPVQVKELYLFYPVQHLKRLLSRC